MSDPRPVRLTLLASRLRLPVDVVRQAVYDLSRHWGMDRVTVIAASGLAVTPAAVVAIHQAFGVRRLPANRTTPKEHRA